MASDADVPLPVEVQRLETELAEAERAIAHLRDELGEARDEDGHARALARGRRRVRPGLKGLGLGFVIGLLLALVVR